jgi:ABC-type multidrug transport system fused ATPase/permease subunit
MISVLKTLWPYLRRHRGALVLAAAAMIGEVLTALATPWPLKFVFDSVLFTHGPGAKDRLRTVMDGHTLIILAVITGAALLIALFDGLFTYLDDRTTDVVAQQSIYELRRNLFSHLQRLTIAFHQDRDTRLGDLLSRLSGDIQALQDLAASGVSNIVTNGLTIGAMVGIMYWLNWRLATVALALTVPMYLVARHTTNEMRQALRRARHQEGRVSAVLQESLTAIKLIQAFGLEDHESRRLEGESRKSLDASLDAAKLQSRLVPSVSMFSAVGLTAVTVYGVYLAVGRSITPGELLIFLGYLRNMQSPIRQLAKLSFAINKASAGVERIDDTFRNEPLVESPQAINVGAVAGNVEFSNVTFGYEPGSPVLRGVDLTVEPGQVVALVGATGSGKTSLLSLLPRFYDPWEGSVAIDGHDVRDLSLRSLRAQISLVLQDSLIFRTTIRENIAFGRPEATDDEIEAAAEAAGVGVFAPLLEDGYDTIVSERGASLSGGQKQCIGLARAILKDAPIAILDEPTSSMDPLTEKLVMDGFARLSAGRTTFVIAHRLATVRNADLVAVLDHGQVIELGSPSALLERNGRFAEFARTQALV